MYGVFNPDGSRPTQHEDGSLLTRHELWNQFNALTAWADGTTMTVGELRVQASGLVRPNYEEVVQKHFHDQARSRGAATGGRGDDPAAHAEGTIRANVVYESILHGAIRAQGYLCATHG